ncbi:MAG TPA: pyrimidine/purine nucleotide monophosphate nucleosidase domain-containing protein, partial [Xanthomonadales bacterium]|nr:pyrimidine/purine nucleotide monophosphate nucleosidase domain-containing protein [Xanthomonadales bacterium]
EEARSKYEIIIADPDKVATTMADGIDEVRKYRITQNDAFYFNWLLNIDQQLQLPFKATHENMRSVQIDRTLPLHEMAANLRRVFSGIVAGNVKPEGLEAIRKHGHFEIFGDQEIMQSLDALLSDFVRDNRMKLPGGNKYKPCYRVVT